MHAELATRKVWISSSTAHPDSAWVAQQAGNFCMDLPDGDRQRAFVFHDSGTKFTKHFRGVLKAEGLRPKKLIPVSPNLNAYVERFVQTIQQECLGHFVVLGESHLDHLVTTFVRYYHELRPHQSLENRPPARPADVEAVELVPSNVTSQEFLGELLNGRRAA